MSVKGLLRSAAVVVGLGGTVAGGGYVFSQALADTIKRSNDAHQEQVGAQPNLLTQWMESKGVSFAEKQAAPEVIPAAHYDPQKDEIGKLIRNLDM